MNPEHPRDPLHGVKLATIMEELLAHYGWDGLADRIHVRCFEMNPSISSSLKFLRKTPWAREKVEALYLDHLVAKEFEAEKSAGQGGGIRGSGIQGFRGFGMRGRGRP